MAKRIWCFGLRAQKTTRDIFWLFILYVFRGKFTFVFGRKFSYTVFSLCLRIQTFYGPKSKISTEAFCSFLVEFIVFYRETRE